MLQERNAAKKGAYVFHYGAPVFIVTANKKSYGNAMADSACALENMIKAQTLVFTKDLSLSLAHKE